MSAAQNDQAKLRKRLEALLKLPDNQTCADCRKRGPRWASANLGIFICIECSGIHRNLGVHISFVRSVNLDSWTKQQVDFMEEWGNGRANEYFEANVPSHVIKPKEGDPVRVVERFIRDKYEFRRYIAKEVPPKNENVAAADPEPEPVVARRASKHHGHHHHGHHSHHQQQRHEEAPKPAEVPKPAAPAPAPSLLDFMDDSAPAAPVVAQPAPVANHVADPFGSTPAFPAQNNAPPATAAPAFDPFATAPQPATQQSAFGGFDAPAAQPNGHNNFATGSSGFDFVNNNQPPQPPKASADAILSLYSANMNRGGPPMPMAGGFNQPMYPPNHAPPMMNVNPNQPRGPPMGFGGAPAGYPPQPGYPGGAPAGYPGMGYNPAAAPPVNPFAHPPPHGMQQGYPPNYPPQYAQPPVNPFQQQQHPGMIQMNSQFQQQPQGWGQR